MGDQDMATFDDADWSEDSCMDECDPGAPARRSGLALIGILIIHMRPLHTSFVCKILPNDNENRGDFDNGVDFRIGDPNVHFRAAAAKSYETTEDIGKPDWNLLFGFILARMSHLRFLSTVYVLVDNRDLTNLDNPDPSLQHWPAVAAWWSSRACMQGPASELCDVVFFPISEASGLHLVHHTWAGTFVLAALCLVFPGLHIVLLDSDCVPVTLFEVEDLWQEAQRLQHCGFPGPVPTSSWAGGLNSDQQDQPTLPKPKEQGVILVTEHNAEVNAGFAVLRGSNHAPPLLEEDWQSIPLGSGESQDLAIRKYKQKLVSEYWKLVATMVSHGRDDRDMTQSECQAWIQTGLALAPFCGHMMNTSLEWAVAWSLVGEWTTRTIFLPPKGECFKAHAHRISYHRMISGPSPCCMLTWARACFEKGSLPSLLALPGDASLMVLPRDGMFQAHPPRIVNGKCRPVILHGYLGGAKKDPACPSQDWRPILGTSVSNKESLLLPQSVDSHPTG